MFFAKYPFAMLYFWLSILTFIILVNSAPQAFNDLQPETGDNPDSSIFSQQDALTDVTDPDGVALSQSTDTSDTDSYGLSNIACTSDAPTDNAIDGNAQIIRRGNSCSANPPNNANVSPPRPKPVLKKGPQNEPAREIPKPVIKPKVSSSDNPCVLSEEIKDKTRRIHVTCTGEEAATQDMPPNESALVVNCIAGVVDQLIDYYTLRINEEVDEYCCREHLDKAPFYFGRWCTRLTWKSKKIKRISQNALKKIRKQFREMDVSGGDKMDE